MLDNITTLEVHKQKCHGVRKFSCNLCAFETALYTDLLKHKMTHLGGNVKDIDPGELLVNVIIAQQDSILEEIARSEKRMELCLKAIIGNQENIYDEIKQLKTKVQETKQEVVSEINTRVDNLSKSVAAIKDNNIIQSQTNQGYIASTIPQKKKILLVGDSLSRNMNISVIKNVTDMDMKRVEAFIVDKDDPKAKTPTKNFTEIVPRELVKDNYSTLILQAGTNEVSNLDVTENIEGKIESLKNEIKASS
jgi:hypothetical protein